jgi:hypothetical protein
MSTAQIESSLAQRILSSRTLSESQMKRWNQRLSELLKDFLAEPYERVATGKAHKLYALLIAFGERPLIIKGKRNL